LREKMNSFDTCRSNWNLQRKVQTEELMPTVS
jgi:hypothetical protein